MFAHDPMRTGWASEERLLSTLNVSQLELKWKVQVNNEPRFLTALTAPIVATDVETSVGVGTFVYVAGSSNNFHALDAKNGAVVWSRKFDRVLLPRAAHFRAPVCPNGSRNSGSTGSRLCTSLGWMEGSMG
jgi:outer membrane protein assembly factor BamB